MGKKLGVLAGRYEQYQLWKKVQSPEVQASSFYISSVESLLGHDYYLIRVGTWYEQPHELLEAAETRSCGVLSSHDFTKEELVSMGILSPRTVNQ